MDAKKQGDEVPMHAQKIDFVPRMEGLDALRGFALFGLFLVHMPEMYELYWAHPTTDPIQLLWHNAVFKTFSDKAFALLALCFGVSFFIIMDRSARRGVDFTGRFIWRLVVLGAIGLLHCLCYRGEVLQVLAMMGLFLLPFYRVRSNRLIVAIAVFFLLQPILVFQMICGLKGAVWANAAPAFWSNPMPQVYLTGDSLLETMRMNWTDGRRFTWEFMWVTGRLSQILGLSLIGMVLGRIGFFSDPDRFKFARHVGLIVAVVVMATLSHWGEGIAALVPATPAMFMPRNIAGTIVGSLTNLSIMSVLMLGFLSLYYGPGHAVLKLLAPAGRMTLTLYVGQSLVFVPVFYSFGLGLHATMLQSTAVLIGLAAFAAQVVLAHWWFGRFVYGPLEWIWRAATYQTTKVPFRRKTIESSRSEAAINSC
jgi:uncharacterized protein